MSTTGFFGLQKLGASDPLSTSDYAFTNRNMDVIDRLLGKFDAALFSGTSPIDDPVDPPTLSVSTTGGIIPAGRTVRYKFAWVDTYGNESAASPEATVTTDAPVTRPAQPGLAYSASGGTLLGGNYFYVLSAYVGINTSETNGGTAAALVVRGGTANSVTITLPSLPAGADGFNIFRRGPGEAQFFYLDSVDMTVATPPTIYVDDNSVTVNNSRTPLANNMTYSTNSISITVPGATPYVPTGYTWKLYRSFNAGEWASTLLEWVVEETFTGSGVIVPTAYDYGLQATIGSPPDISHITSSVNRIDTLETDVAQIQTELGTNPQGIYADVAARLDGIDTNMLDTWQEVWSEDLEGATPPTAAAVFNSVVQGGSSTAATANDGSQTLEVTIVGTDPAYVVKELTITSGTTVAYDFSAYIPSHNIGEQSVFFRADSGLAFPGVEDFVQLVAVDGRQPGTLRFGIDWGFDGTSIDGVYFNTGYDFEFWADQYHNFRLEIDWAPITQFGQMYNYQVRLYVDGILVKTLDNIAKPDSNALDRAIFGSYSATTVAVTGLFKFDNFYVESKDFDLDRLSRETVTKDILTNKIDPFEQYPLRDADYQGGSNVLLTDVITAGQWMTNTARAYKGYKMIGQIRFNAPPGEDLRFRIVSATYQATPMSVQDLWFTVEPGSLASPSGVGTVYIEGDEVVLTGTSSPLAVTIMGSFFTAYDADITLQICQNTVVATPVGSTLLPGTWFSIESLYTD